MMNDDDISTKNPSYAQFPVLDKAWLYIAIDIRDMSMVKIGLTRRESPHLRVSQGKTYNPFLVLFTSYELSKCTFGSSQKELDDIERYIHSRSIFEGPIRHLFSGINSEWFFIDPEEAENQIDWILAKRGFSVAGKNLYSHDIKYQRYNGIAVDRMIKIKTIYRPFANSFFQMAESYGIPFSMYRSYYDFLNEFHSRDSDEKIYL